ncbi:MAG: dihydroorotase family protein [Promethearchaeota archaeon]
MQNKILKLINAKIFSRQTLLNGGILIENGVITKIAKEPNLPQVATTLDVNGQMVIPGVIDAHVHLRDFDLAYKETFQTGTYAAAMGGVTTVLDMPNTKPPTINSRRLLEKKQKAKGNIFTNVGFFSGLPESIEEIGKLAKEKIAGFKIYPHVPISSIDLNDDELLLEYFKVISSYDLPICIHPDIQKENKIKKSYSNEKEQIIEFLRIHDVKSEVESIERFCKLALVSKNKLHFAHITTKQSLVLIKEEQRLNRNITCEALPHHLLLSEDDLFKWKSWAKTLPPLRSQTEMSGLYEGLRNGEIDILASDHAPHSLAEKSKSFVEAPSGIPGVETLVPLMMTEVLRGRLSLDRFVILTSERPAQIFNLGNTGKIEEGHIANLTIINTKIRKKINPEGFYSKAKFSPFKGYEIRAIPSMTIVNGQIVMQDGQIQESAQVGKTIP